MRRRRGFTLVETLVFGTMAMALLVTSWNLFGDALRRGGAATEKLEAVQGALLLSLTLEEDLESLYEPIVYASDERRLQGAYTSTETRLTFHRFARTSAGESWEPVPLQRVTYAFDASRGLVLRQVDDEPPRVLRGRYERLNFRVSNPGQDEAPSVVYSIVGLSGGAAEQEEAGRGRTDRSVLVGGVPRYAVADAAAYPHWNPVPYGPRGED